ncbi:DUF2339 domain-containing protein [Mycobacterium sp. MYCO198283]|uniref:DUF2339 domain-containing protein n=1 Tax=Mycobacterium sp. MYCO198283 TaxID=2883505 RepID=UPI001E56C008|nr:DUF2339 domain-containing protein [Mycobacterium sp. MYCO198283]MCG5433485.1 DUF2339 domain-containing protein [Mycobacterium sp. MYCO198283]
MVEPPQDVVAKLSTEITDISGRLARAAAELRALQRQLAAPQSAPVPQPAPVPTPQPVPYWQPDQAAAYWQQYYATEAASNPAAPPAATPAGAPAQPVVPQPTGRSNEGLIGKVLATAGVAVTLIGVVLLLVLAAQAGLLRPELRVAGGAVFAAALVGAGMWFYRRPGGRVGAVALAATGVAAAYIDVIAATTGYGWLPPGVGLVLAAVVAAAGLALTRRWNSQALGLLVIGPLLVLAPIVTDGVTMLLIGFMLALAAVSLPVQLGRNWLGLHAARIAAPTLPLLLAIADAQFDADTDGWALGAACAVAAFLAVVATVLLLRWTTPPATVALLGMAGVVPLLACGAAVPRVLAAPLLGVLAVALVATGILGARLPGVAGPAADVFKATGGIAAVLTVMTALTADVTAPVLLAMAAITAVAAGGDRTLRWVALGVAAVGAVFFLAYAGPGVLARPTETTATEAVSTLAAAVLLVVCAVVLVRSWSRDPAVSADTAKVMLSIGVVVIAYAVTAFTVTAGVLAAGVDGFLAGHTAATICWIAMAAALFGYAARRTRADRPLPLAGGLALTAAAMAKLFLFDLGTLDGIFRVAVFIVVGLVLLGMGAGYAKLLSQQDRPEPPTSDQQRVG